MGIGFFLKDIFFLLVRITLDGLNEVRQLF